MNVKLYNYNLSFNLTLLSLCDIIFKKLRNKKFHKKNAVCWCYTHQANGSQQTKEPPMSTALNILPQPSPPSQGEVQPDSSGWPNSPVTGLSSPTDDILTALTLGEPEQTDDPSPNTNIRQIPLFRNGKFTKMIEVT